jgi:tetratricopeptide (TPR) repeat protein
LFWKEANERFNERHFAEAIAAYAQITPDFVHYEAALVDIAKAHAATGDFAAARSALAAFREHVDKTPLSGSDTQKQQVRSEALADAEFTEVGIAYYEARGSAEFQVQGDLTKYPAALEKAQAFLTNFAKDGAQHLPHVLEYIGRLQTDLGRLDLAEAAYKQLQARDELRASRLATGIFKEYQGQVKSLTDELDRAIAAGKTDDEITRATAEVNAMRGKLVALGTDYIAASPKPQLAILIGTMLAWEQLREWPRVETVARKAIELYGAETDQGTKQAVDRQVRGKLGEALLQQGRFTEAYDMLVAAEKADPTHWELKRQICRALGGWFEFNSAGGTVKEPGLDRPAEAYAKYFQEYRAWALRPEVKPFSLDWYRFHWELYWFASQAAAKDGKMKDIADRIYRIARATDDFATLKGHGAAGMLLFRCFQANH